MQVLSGRAIESPSKSVEIETKEIETERSQETAAEAAAGKRVRMRVIETDCAILTAVEMLEWLWRVRMSAIVAIRPRREIKSDLVAGTK